MFFMFAMAKAIVPRYRYDQLMRLGWKVFLPLSLAMVAIVAGVLQYRRAGAEVRMQMRLDRAAKALFLAEFVTGALRSPCAISSGRRRR